MTDWTDTLKAYVSFQYYSLENIKTFSPPEQTADMFKCDKLRYKSCLFPCETFVELVSLLQSLAGSSRDCFTWGFYRVCSNYKCMLLNTTEIIFSQKQHVGYVLYASWYKSRSKNGPSEEECAEIVCIGWTCGRENITVGTFSHKNVWWNSEQPQNDWDNLNPAPSFRKSISAHTFACAQREKGLC